MGAFKQPPRLDTDGAVHVQAIDDHQKLMVSVVDDGTEHTIVMSPFNASRVFGMLAMMLGIPLPPATGKAIKF